MEYRQTLLPEPERQTYFAGDAFSELALLRMLQSFGNMEIVFDSVSKSGMNMMRKKGMKQMGYADAGMFFYLESAAALARKIGSDARAIAEEPDSRHM